MLAMRFAPLGAPLHAPSCAPKLELSLCVGIACGKADLGEKKTLTSTANQVVHSCRNGTLHAERALKPAPNAA